MINPRMIASLTQKSWFCFFFAYLSVLLHLYYFYYAVITKKHIETLALLTSSNNNRNSKIMGLIPTFTANGLTSQILGFYCLHVS